MYRAHSLQDFIAIPKEILLTFENVIQLSPAATVSATALWVHTKKIPSLCASVKTCQPTKWGKYENVPNN